MTDPQTTGNPGNPGAQAVQAVQQVSREGALRRVWRWLVGSHPRLRESEGRTSWLSYMLMLVQSMTLVLIGGSVELRTLMSGASLPEMTLMALSLGILVLSTYAADMATQRTMGRIGILLRNRRTLMATEHILYVAFVVGVEMATFGIALIGIELKPEGVAIRYVHPAEYAASDRRDGGRTRADCRLDIHSTQDHRGTTPSQ